MKKIMIFMAIGLLMSSFVLAKDVVPICEGCHGKDGNSDGGSKVPSIAGFSTSYILDSFNAYRQDKRPSVVHKGPDGVETTMIEIAKSISYDDADKAATYFASKTFKVNKQPADAKKADLGRKIFQKNCDKCHEDGGNPEDDNGILLGQWKPYIEQQLENIYKKTRTIPKNMQKKFNKLSPEDKINVVEYLARGEL